MTPWLVRFSTRSYERLLRGYPPGYRQRFSGEMSQVFRLLCRDRYRQDGPLGLARLWLPALWDWAWTAADQWMRYLVSGRRYPVNGALDQQIGDMVWSIATGLRAGYNLREVFQALSAEAPEPAASACRLLLADLEKGLDLGAALAAWKQALPSAPLARLADLLDHHLRAGGHLPGLLDDLEADLLREYGSDPAYYPAMRREAGQLGAKIPARAIEQKN